MMNFTKILAFCALAAGACLAAPQAHAQPSLTLPSEYVPRLGASVSSIFDPSIWSGGGVIITDISPGSPLRRMYSDYIGWFYADPGDIIVSANGAPIRDAAQLNWIVDNVAGRMAITVRDVKAGRSLSGWVIFR
jgi:S1-C subfamily serine protease